MSATKRQLQRKKILLVNSVKLGKGDSVKEIAEYWGDATIEEIYRRVMEWKAKQQPKP
jgi:hypothetical protein